MERRTTKITRSWGATIGYLVGAAAALVISILLFMTIAQGPVTLGIALIPAIVGIILLFMSFGGSGTSTCPGCQSRLTGLSTKSNDGVLCGGCNHYLEGNGGSLWQTDENRISDVPLFSSPLPAQFGFPGGCCVCGRPEAGLEKISLSNQNASFSDHRAKCRGDYQHHCFGRGAAFCRPPEMRATSPHPSNA